MIEQGPGSDSESTTLNLSEAVASLIRGGWDELESTLVEFGDAVLLADTRSRVRCHFVRSTPNGLARVKALASQLANQIVHFCIPRSDLEAAQALPPDRQAPAIIKLAREAESLFTQTQVKTGEGGELLLYALLEKRLGIPQIMSKMSFKTSTEMQIHGADGVHGTLLDDGNLALYWGEAKLYDSLPDAMSSCLDSLEPYLVGDAHEQDLFLLRHHADAGNAELTARLLEYFDNGSLKSAHVEMRGACLIGFSQSEYPVLPRDIDSIADDLESQLAEWRRGMRTRVRNRKLEQFEIEVFFVPVPTVQDLRNAIKLELRIPVTE